MTLTWKDIAALLGGATGLIALAGVCAKLLIDHLLGKDMKKFEALLSQAQEDREHMHELHLKAFDARLTQDQKDREASLAAHVRQIEMKLPVYKRLWDVSQTFRSSFHGSYSPEVMREGATRLRKWYYTDGEGALLSFHAQTRLQAGLKLLDAANPADSPAITQIFGGLRTQLKLDLGFYDDHDAALELPVEAVIKAAHEQKHYCW